MAISLRALTVAVFILLGVLTAASAADIQIRGLTEQTTARAGGPSARAYLTGTCQPKKASMHCHLHHIEVKKLDTTLLAAQAAEIIAQAQQDPDSMDTWLARHMPALCQEYEREPALEEAPSPSTPLSPGEQELRQATAHFCAERSVEHLRAVLDIRLQMQARTCAVWVESTTKTFTLRDKAWLSQQGPSGPCGVMETAVLSHPLQNSHGQETHFHRYSVRQTMTRPQSPHCQAGEARDYVFVVEHPWYAACQYIDFSPMTFGWSVWRPRAP